MINWLLNTQWWTPIFLQAVHQKLMGELEKQGRELPPIGIGISSGEVIAGEFGPPRS